MKTARILLCAIAFAGCQIKGHCGGEEEAVANNDEALDDRVAHAEFCRAFKKRVKNFLVFLKSPAAEIEKSKLLLLEPLEYCVVGRKRQEMSGLVVDLAREGTTDAQALANVQAMLGLIAVEDEWPVNDSWGYAFWKGEDRRFWEREMRELPMWLDKLRRARGR